MSINFHFDEGSRLVTLRISGSVTRDMFLHYSSLVEDLIAEHGRVRLLLVMHDFSMSPAAFFEDLKFDVRHRNDLERVGVVVERRWQKVMAGLFSSFNRADFRVFDASDEDAAWDWVHEGVMEASGGVVSGRRDVISRDSGSGGDFGGDSSGGSEHGFGHSSFRDRSDF
jgi:hypothetical protein